MNDKTGTSLHPSEAQERNPYSKILTTLITLSLYTF